MRGIAAVVAGAMLLAGCGHPSPATSAPAAAPVRFERAPAPFDVPDPAPRPPAVLLLHGHNGMAKDFASIEGRLRTAGFDPHVASLPSGDWQIPAVARQLGAQVDALRQATGQDRIGILAHSTGGVLARYYLEHGGLAKVQRLVCVAAPNHGVGAATLGPWQAMDRALSPLGGFLKELNAGDETPGDVVYTCLWSTTDTTQLLPRGSCRLTGAYTYRTSGVSHGGMLTTARLVPAMIEGLRRAPGGQPGAEQEI